MTKRKENSLARRNFLTGAAAGAAVLIAQPLPLEGQEAGQQAGPTQPGNGAARLNSTTLAGDIGVAPPPLEIGVIKHPGSDFMVDVLKTLDIEYVASNPGSTFDGLHESLINYGKNQSPEFLTCCHEESAVAMAHGYAKIEGKPMMALIHGTVGLQHSAMAIYNAYADRVPIYIVVGNHADGAVREAGGQSYHSANDVGALVRDFVKWDDAPQSLGAFAESAVRAYKIALTPPMSPVVIVASHETQVDPMKGAGIPIPKLVRTNPPSGDRNGIAEAARLLLAAERPLIITERSVRTPNGMRLLVELAETIQAPVSSRERMEFPNRHPLAGTGGAEYRPDLILCLEVADVAGVARLARAQGAKTINISTVDLFQKSNIQDFGHYASDLELDLGADSEITLPELIEGCKRIITANRKAALARRGAQIAEAHRVARVQAVEDARYGWAASPVSLNRLCAELWPLIENEDWSLVSPQPFISRWPSRLWNFEKTYQYIGGQGAGGMGYGAPAAVGAALANRKHGRISINIQTDGDLNYAPSVLWTAAHHRIPLLTIMHNNRGYHAEAMIVEQRASQRDRGQDRCHIGTKLWEPNINYAKMAEAYGLYGEGPIDNPVDLTPALKRGLERVKKGDPVVIDVVTQPR